VQATGGPVLRWNVGHRLFKCGWPCFVGEGQGLEAAETSEGARAEAEGGDAGLAAFFSEPSFFSPAVLSEFPFATVGFSLSE
jgi:hypothetical protein